MKDNNKIINISKDSEYAIGRMLVRGHSNGTPFYSKLFQCEIGNIRNAISFMSREGMTKEMMAKTKLTKKDMAKLVDFPKKRIDGYNSKLKSICEDRILADKQLMLELAKFINKDENNIAISFIAKDKDNKNHMSMERYLKVLNQLMNSADFTKKVQELTYVKPKPKMEVIQKKIEGKNRTVKSFNKNNIPKNKSAVVLKQNSSKKTGY